MANEKDSATTVKDMAAAAKDTTRRTSGETRDAAQEFGRVARQGSEQVGQITQSAGETVSKSVDIGGQVAQSSIEGSQRLIEGAANSTRDMSVQVSRNMEALMSAQGAMAEGLQSVWQEWLRYSQDSLQRWADQAQTLLRVRSMQDLVSTQSDILRVEMEHLMKSGQRISELATKAANDAANRVIRREEDQADDIRRSA